MHRSRWITPPRSKKATPGRGWLFFYRWFRINPDLMKLTIILPAGAACKEAVIILLLNPADEQQTLATTVKSNKSNASE